jgi:beta-lactamase regulating signal transducer with metallopeptidase domain/type II secretory pathway component GspD/PulD (secretin)
MNSFIETLNQWGGNFLSFAWPMLWQSSLLIVALLAFDFLFRRKLRASIRYALWLVVLVKLCVPPTLALPTSPAWWLQKTPPPIAAKAEPHYTVTYDNGPLSEIPQASLPVFVPPKPAMMNSAWLLIASAAVSSALLGWLLVRWWQITRQVRRAAISERMAALADEAQKIVGLKFKVQVKLTTNSMSPAVCGLFRPAILIPQSLAENFSDEQLRAVLLHELIHLRRRDVWLNFLQSLLQIFYWWHPLVWLANARIRQVREEAVDDAVMLVLRDEAETYAPTLLEVAKLALNRPLASLGLVGILESRHALRQRIERLVDFRPPRQAGLTLVSLLGILAFTAVAVPMGGGPAQVEKTTLLAPAVSTPPVIVQNTNTPSILIMAHIYQMRAAEFDKIVSGLKFNQGDPGDDSWWSASPEKFRELTEKLTSSGFQPITRPRMQTSSGKPAQMYVGDGTNGIEFDCTPFVAGAFVDMTIQGKVVDATGNDAVTNLFNAKTSAENYGGIVIRTKNVGGSGESNVVVVTGVGIATNTAHFQQRLQAIVKRRSNTNEDAAMLLKKQTTLQPATTMTFRVDQRIRSEELKKKLLDAGVKIPPTAFFYTDSGILLVRGSEEQLARVNRLVLKLNGFSAKDIEANDKQFLNGSYTGEFEDSTNFFERKFKMNTMFISALQKATGLQTTNVSTMVRSFFSKLGVDLESHKGKSVFFNDGTGWLFVRATEADLDTIERAIQALNYVAPMIHIKARFLEVPQKTFQDLVRPNLLTNDAVKSGTNTGPDLLTNEKFKAVLRALEQRDGVVALAEPDVTTMSGRQTQMRATQIINVVTNFALQENGTNVSVFPQTEKVETGPILDTVAYVLADGHTINLSAIATVTDFLGYDQPTNTTAAYNQAGEKIDLPKALPKFRVQQATASVNLRDGQTAILGKFESHSTAGKSVAGTKPEVPEKELLVFITATIVDPAGNRVHSDDELPFAHKGIPPQPPQPK